MTLIKLTSKRQATFPAEVCKELGVGTGDTMELHRRREGGKTVWILKPVVRAQPAWMGSLQRYARGKTRPWTREQHGEATGRAMAREGAK